MKIGLFFGSFNPIHTGHLIIGNVMVSTTDLDKIWFVVSPQNPLKKNDNLLHEFDRMDLVDSAIANNHLFNSCDLEFQMLKPSYTIDTLTYISEKYKDKEFSVIIGEDNLIHFKKWKNHDQILERYKLYVYPRPNSKAHEFADHPSMKFIDAPVLNISATFIRKCIQHNQSIQYMVPERVAQLIESKGFYLTKQS